METTAKQINKFNKTSKINITTITILLYHETKLLPFRDFKNFYSNIRTAAFNKKKGKRDRCEAHRDAAVKAQALRQEKEKRHRNIWAHRCTIVERAAQLRALATGKKAKEKQDEEEEE